MTIPEPLATFLAAVEARDLDGVLACFHDDASYAYAMPLPALSGRDAIGAMFGGLMKEAEAIRWDIVTCSVDGDRIWTERIDRFTFGGREVAIECMGLFEYSDGRIRSVRDYVDMATWRERKGA